MSNLLSRKVSSFARNKSSGDGDIGIEVEVEGKIVVNPGATKWSTHEDGSLRNGGIEFVTQGAIPCGEIDRYVADLKRLTKGSQFKPSIRTSVHVHVNVRELTILQTYIVMMTYWLFENMLVELQNEYRKSNLHCLRLTDSHAILTNAIDEIKSKTPFRINGKNDLRYGALNLAALNKFGSLEFRFMEFSKDLDSISTWSQALYDFVSKAKNTKFENLLRLLREDPRDVIKFFWSNEIGDKMLNINSELLTSYWFEHHDKIEMLWKKLEIVLQETSSVNFGKEDEPLDKPKFPENEILLLDGPQILDHYTQNDVNSMRLAGYAGLWLTRSLWLTQEDLDNWGNTPNTSGYADFEPELDDDDDF